MQERSITTKGGRGLQGSSDEIHFDNEKYDCCNNNNNTKHNIIIIYVVAFYPHVDCLYLIHLKKGNPSRRWRNLRGVSQEVRMYL